MHGAIHTAMIKVQSKIGNFAATFAPQTENGKEILRIFDILTTVIGFSLPVVFNVGEYKRSYLDSKPPIVKSNKSLVKTGVASTAASITTSAAKPGSYTFNGKAYSQDMAYQLYTITAAWTRNNAPK
jgi:hypothetical protein